MLVLENGDMYTVELEKVLAMAVAAVAEEAQVQPDHVIVRSFKEIQKSSLEKYIEDHQISYKKYQLEDQIV